jgi:hypothetical protein
MIFIYVSELQEEAPMDKKHQKRGKEASTRSPTLIYMDILQRSQGERNRQRKRSGKKDQKHEDRGRHTDRGSYPFFP